MRVGGERGALAGFEVHDVVAGLSVLANGSAVEGLAGLVGFCEKGEVYAEAAVGGFGSGDGLKEEINWCAGVEGFELGGDVGEDAALDGDLEALAEGVDHAEEPGGGGGVVSGGVDADDRVAGAEEEAVEDGGGDSGGRVGGVVGLEAGTEAVGKSDGGAEAGDDADFLGGGDEVLDAHEFAYGRGHLGGETGGESGEAVGGGFVGKEPVAELAYGE